MAIYGDNLKAEGETPAVRINGLEARLVASSATRLVVVAPDDDARGAVGVVVGTPRGGTPRPGAWDTLAPQVGVVVGTPRGGTPAVAVRRVDNAAALMPRGGIVLARHVNGSLVSQPGEFEDPWLGRPAQSGETVLLAVTAMPPAATELARLQVFVADRPCVVEALDDWGPGLQRLRIVLPDVADVAAGDLAIRVVLDEKPLPKELTLPLR